MDARMAGRRAIVHLVAMAGDERGDFDELFHYLRDPRLATAYDAQLGSGWFLVPPLFGSGRLDPLPDPAPAAENAL